MKTNFIMRKLQEQITGNIAMVYHGSQEEEVYKYLCEGKWKCHYGVYGSGLYSVYNLSGTQTEDGGYGNYIMKLYVKDLSNYWCFTWSTFQKVHPIWAKHTNEDDFIDYQAEKFNLKDEEYPIGLKGMYEQFQCYPNFLETVDGIIYHGKHDGDCILHYNPYNCRPIAISSDKGKTWKKIDEEYIQEYEYNLSDPEVNKSFYKTSSINMKIVKFIQHYCALACSKYNLKDKSFINDDVHSLVDFETIAYKIQKYIDTYKITHIHDVNIDEFISFILRMRGPLHTVQAFYHSNKLPKELINTLILNDFLDSNSFYKNCNQINTRTSYKDPFNVFDICNNKLYVTKNNDYDVLILLENEENESLYQKFNEEFFLFIKENYLTNSAVENFLTKLKNLESIETIEILFENLSKNGFKALNYAINNNEYYNINEFLKNIYYYENNINEFFSRKSPFLSFTQDEINFVLSNANISFMEFLKTSNDKKRTFFETFRSENYKSIWIEQSDKLIIIFANQKLKFEISKKYINDKDNETKEIFINLLNYYIIPLIHKKVVNNQQLIKLQKIVSEIIDFIKSDRIQKPTRRSYNHIDNFIELISAKNGIIYNDGIYQEYRPKFLKLMKQVLSFEELFYTIDDNLIFNKDRLLEILLKHTNDSSLIKLLKDAVNNSNSTGMNIINCMESNY